MQIVTKKKGENEYFYLRSSRRIGKRVITTERYLGKKIPKNIEEIKKEMKKDEKENLDLKLEGIRKNFQSYWNSLPVSVKEKEKQESSISLTYNTNAIEGSTLTLEETREIIQEGIAPNKPIRDIKETEAHSKVFLKMLEKKENISEELILKWHKEIFEQSKGDIAGKYRTYLVRVGEYIPPDWQEVKSLMNELIQFIKNKELNPVELSARVHYRFESIHPFGDGNGRIGRLLINYILWNAGYPILIIEYKKRASYYKAFQKGEDNFVRYFLRRYVSSNKRFKN